MTTQVLAIRQYQQQQEERDTYQVNTPLDIQSHRAARIQSPGNDAPERTEAQEEQLVEACHF